MLKQAEIALNKNTMFHTNGTNAKTHNHYGGSSTAEIKKVREAICYLYFLQFCFVCIAD